VSLILPWTAGGTIEINVLPIGFPILTKKISSITLITKTKLWKYGNVFACNVAFVQLSSRITKNSQEMWKNDEKRHLTKSNYSLQMKLKTGLSLKNTNFAKNVFLRLTEIHLQN